MVQMAAAVELVTQGKANLAANSSVAPGQVAALVRRVAELEAELLEGQGQGQSVQPEQAGHSRERSPPRFSTETQQLLAERTKVCMEYDFFHFCSMAR